MSVGQTNPLRQQMINMMYLVLMALLALNVSADILKAFALVNTAINKTNAADEKKNLATMDAFAKANADDPKRAGLLYANAKKANDLGEATYKYLEDLKDAIANESGDWIDGTTKTSVKEDQNTEVPSNYFLKRQNGQNGVALKQKLQDFQDQMKKLLIDANGNPNPSLVNIKLDLEPTYKDKEGTVKNWQEYYFEGVPSIAAITELTKFQSDVRHTVAEVNQALIQQIGAQAMKFDALIPVISSPTPSVYSGDKYVADISVGAISNTQQFEATVNGQPVKVESGKAHFETTGSGIGEKTLNINIKYKDQNGEWKNLTTTTKYNVFTGSATISATKMNMLYIGLQNPISVSVPGYRPDQVTVGATPGLNLKKVSNTEYMVNPSPGTKEGVITVSADGKRMGSMQYRVRPIPKPEVLFGTRTGGAMSRGELMTVQYINAGLGAGFAFEGVNYRVLGYTLVFAPRHGQSQFFPVQGNTIPGNLRAVLNAAHTGDMIIITEVRAQGPSGSPVTISGPSITVQ
jgi:gliding motility-associated protein GldM